MTIGKGPPPVDETREQQIDRIARQAVHFNRVNARNGSRLAELLFESYVKDLEGMGVTEEELIRVCPWVEKDKAA